MYNYHHKVFRAVANSENGDISEATIFIYEQSGNIVTGTYSGGNIIKGNLVALMNETGKLDMRYQHVNINGLLMTGICTSTPYTKPNGKLQLHEQWQWTCGDYSKGESVVEEV